MKTKLCPCGKPATRIKYCSEECATVATRKWQSAYKKRNRARIMSIRRAYYHANKDRFRKYRATREKKVGKEAISKYRKVMYEKHKAKIRARGKKYYQENKEKIREKSKAYRLKNLPKVRARKALYRKNNRARLSLKGKAYYAKIREKRRAWRKANAEMVNAKMRAKRRVDAEYVSKKAKVYRKRIRRAKAALELTLLAMKLAKPKVAP